MTPAHVRDIPVNLWATLRARPRVSDRPTVTDEVNGGDVEHGQGAQEERVGGILGGVDDDARPGDLADRAIQALEDGAVCCEPLFEGRRPACTRGQKADVPTQVD